jgi:signal peptidase I
VDSVPERGIRGRAWGRVIIALIAASLAGGAIAGCGGGDGGTTTYEVPSEGMEPTLSVGDKVKVDSDAYEDADPAVGDVILFHPPAGAETDQCGTPPLRGRACPQPIPEPSDASFMMRVVAAPGDRLSIADGHPVVNGAPAEEDFVEPCTPGPECDLPKEIAVPPDHFFVLGDNRGASDDSRFWGPIPRGSIIGKADV